MAVKILFSIIFVLTLVDFSFGDREVNASGIYVKALGRSGKISIGSNENNDTDRIVVEMDELKERDSSGNEVGDTGSPSTKHSFNTFASQDFTFTDIEESTLQDINVTTFQFKSSLLSGRANLTVTVYIFNEDGNITLGDEQNEVERGNVKFSILLENWKFCGTKTGEVTCKKGGVDQIGAFIDFVITIKGKGNPSPKNESDDGQKRGKKYDLGGNGEVVLSTKVQYDGGNFTDMASGYPKTVQKGSKTSFVFRFGKFTDSVFYDPTIEVMPDDTVATTTAPPPTKGPGPSGGASRISLSSIFTFLLLIITVFLLK